MFRFDVGLDGQSYSMDLVSPFTGCNTVKLQLYLLVLQVCIQDYLLLGI